METWKNLEFDNLGKKNLKKPGIWEIKKKNLEFSTTFLYKVVKFRFETKVLSYF